VSTALQTLPTLSSIVPAWKGMLRSLPFFRPIRNERDYVQMQKLMNKMLAVVGDDEKHELADLLDIVSTLIEQYEKLDDRFTSTSMKPRDVLQFLIDEHGLKQSDLKEELGGQGITSEILTGKREINARQAKKLALRFQVSAAVFI